MTGDERRALSPRSLVASVLLGTHPPAMRGALLIGLAERFGIAAGTTRVALSRMVERGELTNVEGRYSLAGELLDRQGRQDDAHLAMQEPWDQTWQQAVIVADARTAKQRHRHRQQLHAAKLAELRDGLWTRPANLSIDRRAMVALHDDTSVVWASVRFESSVVLLPHLWDLDGWARGTRSLIDQIERLEPAVVDAHPDALATGFGLAAAVTRQLVADPQLPTDLLPLHWPAAELRDRFSSYDDAYRSLLRHEFASLSTAAGA